MLLREAPFLVFVLFACHGLQHDCSTSGVALQERDCSAEGKFAYGERWAGLVDFVIVQPNLDEAERRIEETRRTGAESLDLGDWA